MERIDIKELLVNLLIDAEIEMAAFKKTTYDARYHALYNKHAQALIEVENCYHDNGDSEEVLDDLSNAFADYLTSKLVGVKKRKVEMVIFDHNLGMVSFVLPMIAQRKEEFMIVFQEKCVEKWNVAFPKNKIQASSKEKIESGFKWNMCYITTAVCESMNKSDDCYELTLLRDYRDSYLLATDEGGKIVQKYYDIAPTIVKRIAQEKQPQLVYQEIWDSYLNECIHLIEVAELEKTKDLYTDMVEDLSVKYFH